MMLRMPTVITQNIRRQPCLRTVAVQNRRVSGYALQILYGRIAFGMKPARLPPEGGSANFRRLSATGRAAGALSPYLIPPRKREAPMQLYEQSSADARKSCRDY